MTSGNKPWRDFLSYMGRAALLTLLVGGIGVAQQKTSTQPKPKKRPATSKSPQVLVAKPPVPPTQPKGLDTLIKVQPLVIGLDSSTTKATIPDTSSKATLDSLKIPKDRKIQTTVNYKAQDSLVFDVETNTFFLYNKGKVTYGEISLEADRISTNWKTNIAQAHGVKDSTGKLKGKPKFKQGPETYELDALKYNFKTKKALISEVVTKQGEGYLVGNTAKKMPNDDVYLDSGRYTTCNLKHPHFYIRATKLKMIPGDKLVSGPFQLIMADVPTPIGFPLGFFPIPEQRSAGIIVPQYGESFERGFFLRNGGVYFPIGDFAGVKALGEIYTKGSYGFSILSDYALRYRFKGNVELRYNRRLQGDEARQAVFEDFWFNWNHQPITNGISTFSASVNLGSSRFNALNAFTPTNVLNQNFVSRVNYSTSFPGTPFNLSLAAEHTQNVSSGVASTSLPSLNFGMNRQFPFANVGKGNKWYNKLSIGYNLSGQNRFTNRLSFRPSLPSGVRSVDSTNRDSTYQINSSNLPFILSRGNLGMVHSIPITTNFQALKFVNVTPSINYTEYWYFQRFNYSYIPTAFNDTGGVKTDTSFGFGRAYNANFSVSAQTRIYGTFFVRKLGIETVRHIMNPSLSFTYQPDMSDPALGMYKDVQINNTGQTARLFPFPSAIGVPSANRAGFINFGLNNTIEAKVRDKSDTARNRDPNQKPKFEKVRIFDNISFTGGYNLFAEQFKWSNLNFNIISRLFNKIDLNLIGSIDPYVRERNSNGNSTRVNKLLIENGGPIGELRNLTLTISTSFNPAARNNPNAGAAVAARNLGTINDQELAFIQMNQGAYVDFNIPWNLNMTYSLAYAKPGLDPSTVTQTVNMSGDLSLSEKWKIGASGDWDFQRRQFGFVNLNIFRDLHCWEMRLNWIPFGFRAGYQLDINVRSSILQDLKLTRRNSFFDR